MGLVAATAALRFAATAGSFEGVPATTVRHGIGIIDSEACAHQAVNIVNFTAADVAKAHLIYQHAEVAIWDDGIAFLLLVQGHTILETGATTTSDEDAKGKAGIIFLL